jgi:hypothetical protein
MRSRLIAVSVAAGLAAACSESPRSPVQPETFSAPVTITAGQHAGVPHNHRTHLSGENEVFTGTPHPSDSQAQGQAIFQIARDGDSFTYKLIVSNIENVTQAHIHCGPADANGPIIVWLYPSVTATTALAGGAGRHDGVLSEGTVERGGTNHVRARPDSATCPGGVANFDDVLAKIRAGLAYVNVHTNDGVAPTNTGPGDFPGGEVRGQIQ